MFWQHHRTVLFIKKTLKMTLLEELWNWVVLLFHRGNYVSLTLSHWWCFKNIYFFIVFRYNCGMWTDIKKKNTVECVLPKWTLGFADFVFSWKKTRPLQAGCLFMRRWNKLPNVSSCETIRLQGCCQGCFWHLAKSLRAILFLEVKSRKKTSCSRSNLLSLIKGAATNFNK